MKCRSKKLINYSFYGTFTTLYQGVLIIRMKYSSTKQVVDESAAINSNCLTYICDCFCPLANKLLFCRCHISYEKSFYLQEGIPSCFFEKLFLMRNVANILIINQTSRCFQEIRHNLIFVLISIFSTILISRKILLLKYFHC